MKDEAWNFKEEFPKLGCRSLSDADEAFCKKGCTSDLLFYLPLYFK
jgi:hypothetical protein